LCGLRWTLKPGKVQGIEKTCRLNTAVSNFLDPTPESFLSPEISPFPAQFTHLPRPAELSATPRACTTPCYHANLTSIVSMGRFEFFLRFPAPGVGFEVARRETVRRRGGACRRGWIADVRGTPLPCFRPSPDGPADVPEDGVVTHPGGFSSFQAALRTNTPSCHGTSGNQGACRIVGQHVTGDTSFKRPCDVGTDA
jgi:hypothetical protein